MTTKKIPAEGINWPGSLAGPGRRKASGAGQSV